MKYTKTEALVACLVISGLSILGYLNDQKTKDERRIMTMGQPIPPDPPVRPGPPILIVPELEAIESSFAAEHTPRC
jgi:hypothetical protein